MGIFENFDLTSWVIFSLLLVAAIAYYFWPQTTQADAEVGIDKTTRDKANPLIALADAAADQQLFELSPMPLRVLPGAKLQSDNPGTQADIAQALWLKQRELITRLESELDYTQQADVSEHFALAAPANQPAALLKNTLTELENRLGQIRKLLKVEPEAQLWHGKALLVMLSTRKLFDHVAWLMNAGHAASAPGYFTLANDQIVLIVLYATRVELGLLDDPSQQQPAPLSSLQAQPATNAEKPTPAAFTRPLTLQVSRAAIRCVGGSYTPLWLEYGLASWMTNQLMGKPEVAKNEEAPKWNSAGQSIFDPDSWEKSADDSGKLEQLTTLSMLFADFAMKEHADRIINHINKLRTLSPSDFQSFNAWACDLSQAIPSV